MVFAFHSHEGEYDTLTLVGQERCAITPVKNVRPATFGDRIRVAREEIGMSQIALARAVGVSPGSIGNYEAGTRDSSRKTAALAKALKVSPVWLESGTGPMRLSNADDAMGPETPVAQSLSYTPDRLPRKTREELMAEKPVGDFWVELWDDAIAPELPRGTLTLWDAGLEPEPGDFVLIRTVEDKRPHVRVYTEALGGSWEGRPLHDSYATIPGALAEVLGVFVSARQRRSQRRG